MTTNTSPPEGKSGPASVVYRFGLFDADLRTGELRKRGVRVRLQEKPFQILALLLQNQGGLVTREELRRLLWPAGVFVDFDHSLNIAVNRIRTALGDSAETPRYVETLGGRGYRFIAPVDTLDDAGNPPLKTSERLTGGFASLLDVMGQPQTLLRKFLVPAGVIVAALLAGGIYFRSRQSNKLTEKDTVVLVDFTNKTGNVAFDDTLKVALAIQLEQSPFLNMLSEERVNATLKLMNRKPGDAITREVAREICLRTNSKALLAGSIASLGAHYVIALKALNCQTGDSLGSAEAEAEGREKIIKALSEAANVLRGKLGESLASLQKYDKPLEEATTSSLDALQLYTQGIRAAHEQGDEDALPYFKRAVELDPHFARAYASLGSSYVGLNQSTQAIENYKTAFDLRDRVSERERFYIESMYYLNDTGQLYKALQVFTQYVRAYPNDADAHGYFCATLFQLGQWEKSVAECREAVRLNPDNGLIVSVLMAGYVGLNRQDDANAVYKQAQARKLENGYPELLMYLIAFAQGDGAAMQQHSDLITGKPGIEDVLLTMQSDTEAYFGRLKKARDLSQRAVHSAQKNDGRETAALWEAYAALHEAEFGNAGEALKQVQTALSLAAGRDVRVLAALALARAGDVAKAKRIADELNEEFPVDTLMQGYVLPTLYAMMALNGGDGNRALQLLHPTSELELGDPPAFWNIEPPLYPIYVRGRAYLSAGQGQQAAAEFQKVIESRWMNYPLRALAHLQLGRAYALQGDPVKARCAYEDFFALWKNADADIPVLKQAQVEYAKLR